MRFTSTVAAGLALVPSLVSAAGSLGFSLGAVNPDNSCKTQIQYEADFDAILAASGSRLVRVYAAGQCDTAKNILPAAKAKGFQVVLGIWAFPEDSYNLDKNAILQYGSGYKEQIYAVAVGSETLYRKEFTGPQLAAKIKDFKQSAPQYKVGTADSWNKFNDGTGDAVIKESDIIFANAFSYWQGQDINNAANVFFDSIMQAFKHIQSISGSLSKPELWVGETGWPSKGTKYQQAVPSVENAARFFEEGICAMVDSGFKVFAFEAFDEPNKAAAVGDDGSVADETSWGVMHADLSRKYNIQC
ncbi:Glucan 1,3-beta-glucosidase [Ceratocystis fimbriata CBS 114723]|uniref:glucan 1,3-beta-glucosidase n=1 Tax=Ceratocystis fimbriata CBS 114723 TaxID=1035309 RepID=A0A2C5X7Y7_9PEZI|nr:Glucan 1,3-beta-glucosidase [Ceratocystis fimbriata CBS 114723]